MRSSTVANVSQLEARDHDLRTVSIRYGVITSRHIPASSFNTDSVQPPNVAAHQLRPHVNPIVAAVWCSRLLCSSYEMSCKRSGTASIVGTGSDGDQYDVRFQNA